METRAVLCIIGALLINLTLGTFYSIGNLIPYIASYMTSKGFDVVKEQGVWITSSFLTGQSFFLIIGAYIARTTSIRVACIVGSIIHCTATYLTTWALNNGFLALVLIYGAGSGIGCGPSYIASIMAAQRWFPRCKGVVTGLIVSGFALGGSVFTSLQTMYLNPDNKRPINGTSLYDKEVNERVPYLFLYMGIAFTIIQAIGCSLTFEPPTDSGNPDDSSTHSGRNSARTTVVDGQLPSMKVLSTAFQHKIFYIIGIMMMLVAPGVIFVNSLGKSYGMSYIQDDRFLATVVSICAIANALGRLTWGYLADKLPFSTVYKFKVGLFSTLIVLFPFSFILSSKTVYTIVMLGLFFGFSGTFVLFPIFIEQVFGTKHNSFIYGMLYILLATSSILSSVAIQFFVAPAFKTNQGKPDEQFETRLIPCITIATLYIISLCLYLFCIPYKRLEHAIVLRDELARINSKSSLYHRKDLFPSGERQTISGKMNEDGSPFRVSKSLGSIVRFSQDPIDNARKVGLFHQSVKAP